MTSSKCSTSSPQVMSVMVGVLAGVFLSSIASEIFNSSSLLPSSGEECSGHLGDSELSDGKGFALLQPEKGWTSVMIEVGLMSSISEPVSKQQHVVVVEASLESIQSEFPKRRIDMLGNQYTIINSVLSEQNGFINWFERGRSAMNSLPFCLTHCLRYDNNFKFLMQFQWAVSSIGRATDS